MKKTLSFLVSTIILFTTAIITTPIAQEPNNFIR